MLVYEAGVLVVIRHTLLPQVNPDLPVLLGGNFVKIDLSMFINMEKSR